MSLFTNILFLHDYPSRVHDAGEVQSTYSQGYGNRVASARAFAPLGHASHADRPRTAAPARPSVASANDSLPLRACG